MGSEIRPGEKDRAVPGPQVRQGAAFAVQAGEEAAQEGEYTCEGCRKKTHLEKKIIVPRCPDCGGESFRLSQGEEE